MIDEKQAFKTINEQMKKVTDKVAILDLDLIQIILGVHVCLGDEKKVLAWLKTKNPNLGGFAPIKLINSGRAKKVRAFTDAASSEGQFE
jgi:hypothetical protein